MKFMDEAMAELDNLDGLISSYKIHLNVCFITDHHRDISNYRFRLQMTIFPISNLKTEGFKFRLRINEFC